MTVEDRLYLLKSSDLMDTQILRGQAGVHIAAAAALMQDAATIAPSP